MNHGNITRTAAIAVAGIGVLAFAVPASSVSLEAEDNGQVEIEELVPQSAAAAASCGVERWAIKTGTDADRSKITLQSTAPTTVPAMRAVAKPASLPSNNRIQPTETTVFQIRSTLTKFKLESDSDVHMVLDDGNGQTMITEIPDPACVGSTRPLITSIQKTHNEFTAKFTPTTSFQNTNTPVTVTGVGFFDFLHGQTGVAPNGIELHAVLDIQFGTGTGSVSVTNPGNQTGTVGASASLQISATDTAGGTLSYRASGLPAGLSINPGSGLIRGTPTTAGSNSVTVIATDSTGPSASTSFTWTINPAGGCNPTQLLANPGFETGTPAPWTDTGVLNNSSSEPAHDGSWDAWLDGFGTTHTDTLAQTVTLPTGCASYTLSFWLHIDTAETSSSTAFDTLGVQILNNSGAVLATPHTYSNLDHTTGYTQHSFDLAPYAGQTITLKFTGAEDFTKQTSFVIDDTAITIQ
jgi:putative Ig domain-containing protein